MTIQKKIITSLLLFFLFIPFVAKAATISDVSSAYGYRYYDTNNTLHAYQWFGTYSSNNLVKYNYDLPATYEDYGVQMQDFGIRFHIDGGFKSGKNYTIVFTWANYNGVLANWESSFSHLVWYSKCRVSSWSSTAQDDTYCYNNYNMSYKKLNGSSDVLQISLSFSPKVDFYGTSIYFYHDNNPYSYYYSNGWEIYDISYSDTTDSSQAIINNQNQNTQNIINNQNTNTQTIINNQNQNTQAIIDSNQSCDLIDKNQIVTTGKALNSSGIETASSVAGITGYISISSSARLKKVALLSDASKNYCFYNVNKTLISCDSATTGLNEYITIPDNASFVRFTIRTDLNIPTYQLCKNGSQAVTDTITDDNVDGANSEASNFFSGFTTNTYGLTSIITAPLTLIQSLTSTTCSDLVLPLPFVNQNLTLPCMYTIYSQNFGSFLTLYQTITYGIVAYWVIVRIFNLVKDFKNPDHDEIEVMEL